MASSRSRSVCAFNSANAGSACAGGGAVGGVYCGTFDFIRGLLRDTARRDAVSPQTVRSQRTRTQTDQVLDRRHAPEADAEPLAAAQTHRHADQVGAAAEFLDQPFSLGPVACHHQIGLALP